MTLRDDIKGYTEDKAAKEATYHSSTKCLDVEGGWCSISEGVTTIDLIVQ